jgi:hypothetical protein
MPMCCNKIHVGWICPRCGIAMAIKSHLGNEPISIGKIQNVTIVQGDYVKGSIIKDSVVMGDVPSETKEMSVDANGNVVEGNILEDSIVGFGNDNQEQTQFDEILDSEQIIASKEENDWLDEILEEL